jgi:hypothetical protein
LPGSYELHLPADDVTIWYTVTERKGQDITSVQHVSIDTRFSLVKGVGGTFSRERDLSNSAHTCPDRRLVIEALVDL